MNRAAWFGLVLSALVLLSWPSPGDAQAPKEADIAAAVRKGLTYLRSQQREDGTWQHAQIGATALAGWTLLECGVAPTDPSIQKAAAAVRKEMVQLSQNYSLSLCIFFLDRLGDEIDLPLIESMTFRLMRAQNAWGGWDYTSSVAGTDTERLDAHLKVATPGKLNPKLPKDRTPRHWTQLTPYMQRELMPFVRAPLQGDKNTSGDNSNTQFSMMALWVGRRYGMPVERQLLLTEQRFRNFQFETGGWSYEFEKNKNAPKTADTSPSLAMTCAGLLGLALGHASDPSRAKVDLAKDERVRAGLGAVASTIGNPIGDRAKAAAQAKSGRIYYALWSLERMAVAYNLEGKHIGTKDWFGWGAELLLSVQYPDGAWRGDFAQGSCDTCFALLFLKRVNLAADLTAKVKVTQPKVVEEPRLVIPDLPNLVNKNENKGPKKNTDPPSKTGPSAKQLGEELTAAPASKQGAVLDKFKAAKGPGYNAALASAIPALKGAAKTRARAVLTERLSAEPPVEVSAALKSDQVELRRAAALAAGMKKQTRYITELINLLEDAEPPVAHAAHRALTQITSQDFGPEDDATRAERTAAAKAWRAWQKSQKK